MRLAETVRSRWFLALVSIALAGTITMVAWPREAGQPRTMKPWRACGGHKVVRHQAPPPPPRVHVPTPIHDRSGADYQRVLAGAREQLLACVNDSSDIEYKLTIMIKPDGRVRSVDVKTSLKTKTAKLDMHVIKCLEGAVSSLEFPPGPHDVLVSTALVAE